VRKLRKLLIVVGALALGVGGVFLYWQHGQPRRDALQSIYRLATNLANQRGSELLDIVLMPAAVRSQTSAEQQEFVTKALADEVSPEGVVALKHHAEFGPAKSVFPVECANWCQQAGVNADDCIAFKMERAGIRAEVVLLREGETYRVVRCNNVKQMASTNAKS
jgi:hypothetical protein